MKNSDPNVHEHYPDGHHDVYSKTIFGFWMYLLSDFILFGAIFATYAVLRKSTFGGPSAKELSDLPFAFMQSLVLLTCSFVMGLVGAYAHRRNKHLCLTFLGVAFVLGAIFMGMELSELNQLINTGYTWKTSAFLSAHFTMIGTHAVHIFFALLWIIVLGIPVLREGITADSIRRLSCLKLFWQFINIVWIFIFSFIYVMGGIL